MPELLAPIAGILTPLNVTVMLVTMVGAGFMRGFVGFGASMVMVMMLSQVVGPTVAVPVACLSGIPVVIQLLPTAIRRAERPFVVPLASASILAAPLGTWVLVTADGAAVKIAISLIVLAMVALMYRGWQMTRRPGPGTLVAMGLFSGVIQGGGGIGGPPAVVVALARAGTTERQRANVIGAVGALNFCAVPPLAWYGLFTREVVLISLMLIPVYLAASWLGMRFFVSGGHRHFRNAALLLLTLIGLVTLAMAVHDAVGRGPAAG